MMKIGDARATDLPQARHELAKPRPFTLGLHPVAFGTVGGDRR